MTTAAVTHDTPAAPGPFGSAGAGWHLRPATALAGVLLLGGLLRLGMATAMPCLSRDGVVFCWYARDLGRRGVKMLADRNVQQHPLFPAAILATHEVALRLGIPDGPLTWQRCGQFVSWLSGVGLMLAVSWISLRLVRRLRLAVDPHRTAIVAALLVALLPLGVWLSADVMSDPTHALLYMSALALTVDLRTTPAAAACGLLGGLAFLTRPEGAVVVPAALTALLAARRTRPLRRTASLTAVVVAGFLLAAGPYWLATGRLSAKKSPLELLRRSAWAPPVAAPVASPIADTPPAPAPLAARLRLMDLPGYAVLPWVVYTLLRAGRVVIVLLAIGPLLHLRRHLLGPQLAGMTAAATLHLALTTVLLAHWHYLAPRHLLVVVLMLIPLAAVAVVHAWDRSRHMAHGRWVRLALAGCFAVLVPYALRVPNGTDGYLRTMAAWISRHVPGAPQRVLLGGSSHRRVAFYARTRFLQWSEDPADAGALADLIVSRRPDLLLVERGPGYERQGGDRVLAALRRDSRLSGRLRVLHEEPGPRGTRLTLLRLDLR